ncbi:MAG: YidC/Oxa1 family insertase periplasmic-domain containing protein [Planctomycetota bacterium]
MDQRRLFLFLTLCFLLMLVFGPKPPAADQPKAENDTEQQEDLAQAADTEAAGASEADRVETSESLLPENADAPLQETAAPLEFVTLGSVDPESPYRIGVTLTNQGAGVRRVELSSERFRDLHDRSGYLGHLELAKDDAGGLRVQSVVAGTPAATAGIEVNDRLVAVVSSDNETKLTSTEQLRGETRKLKPGEIITLAVARGDEAPVAREITLARRPLEVIRPEIENVLMRLGKAERAISSPPSFQLTFEQIGDSDLPSLAEVDRIIESANELGNESVNIPEEIAGVSLRDANWEVAQRDGSSVTFRKRIPRFELEIEKTYRLEPIPADKQSDQNFPGYGLKLDLVVRNLGSDALPIRYRLDGPNGLPVEGWWYSNKVGRTWSAAGIRDVVARHFDNDTVQFGPTDIARGEVEPMQGRPLAFAGVDAQYFSAVLMPEKSTIEEAWIDELRCLSLSPEPKPRSNEGRYANATCRLISHPFKIAAGESLEHTYEIFAGPKRPDLLANYHASNSKQYGLSDLMYYGWFSTVSRGMLLVLHFFYGMIGNYGIAIIMLTVLVRGCMFPVSRKQAQSMAKMQELRPEMDKIKEKYKQDMQKQSQATQELYRKHNINPLAGCLPLFIQMPIFLGLYRALMVDVELRQAPLLGDAIRWCSNLAAPDMFYDWSWFMPSSVNNGEAFIVGLGPYLNVLPLITAGLFLLQQKMFMPEPTNEQAAMQQKIMKYMMLVMGLLFFKVAAGLCIYFIASSIWGIVERKMLPKPPTSESLSAVSGPGTPSTPSRANNDSAPRKRNSKKSKKKKR